ncbi:hypothetical protein O3P69_018105 [Scylla paramamosain]|uniref:Uncharacterized protein n=1 Tax=Scylla paramamosain TaxID=85552 RepID=A0AAW0TKS7_SCYPA
MSRDQTKPELHSDHTFAALLNVAMLTRKTRTMLVVAVIVMVVTLLPATTAAPAVPEYHQEQEAARLPRSVEPIIWRGRKATRPYTGRLSGK